MAKLPPHLRPGRPISDRLSPLSLAVVGVKHPNPDKSKSNRRFEIALCAPGDPVELRPEPKNKHDPNAVAVFSERGVQIGYLAAERAPRIRQLIGEAREPWAVFQGEAEFGAWIRVAFDGEEPTLPAQREADPSDPEADFYPDEEWPD
jgi:hypothetical protein